MSDVTTRSVPATVPALALVAWLAGGTALVASGIARHVPQLVPAWIATSIAVWITAYRRAPAIRAWVDALELRALVLAHAIRLPIGAWFVYEVSRGRLAPVFGERAGYGDLAVGALAVGVALAGQRRPRLVLAFSWLGLVDILVALGTGMYLLLVVKDPLFIGPIGQLPYPLIPAIVVPLVILGHLIVIARLSRRTAR